MSDLLHETLWLRAAFNDLARHYLGDPDTCSLDELDRTLAEDGLRPAALLYVHHLAESVAEGDRLLRELRFEWLRKGRRPRSMRDVYREAGLPLPSMRDIMGEGEG